MNKIIWIFSFILAITFHLGLGVYYIYKPEISQGAQALGTGGFEVSISMAAAQIGAEPAPTSEAIAKEVTEEIPEPTVESEPVEVEPIEETLEEPAIEEPLIEDIVEEPILEDPLEDVVEEEVPDEIVEDPIQEVVEEIIDEPLPEPVVEETIIEEVEEIVEEEAIIFPRPTSRPQIEPKPEPVQEVVKQVEVIEPKVIEVVEEIKDTPTQTDVVEKELENFEPPTEAASTPQSQSQGASAIATELANRTDSENQVGGGSFVGQITPDYLTELRYWLEKHKGYPKFAKRRKQEGVAMLAFTMTRDGQVLDFSIRKSSGYEKLDDETIKMLQRAQPLPRIPNEISGDILKLVLPIQFSVSK